MKEKQRYILFSNGTDHALWEDHNCENCIKGSHYNEKTDTYTKYRCAIQKEIHEAFWGDGMGSKRAYDCTHKWDCSLKKTERKQYPKKPKFDSQPKLFEI